MVKKAFLSTHIRGCQQESRACAYLEQKGYRIVERNFRWRGGEVDIVALSPEQASANVTREFVFVEVRSSAKAHSSYLRYTISPAKRLRLIHTIKTYFFRRPATRGHPFRVDLIWIEESRVEHWKNVILW